MNWFTNLRTRTKLAAGVGLIIALLIAIVLVGLFAIRAVRDAESSTTDIMTMRNNFNGQRAAMLAAVHLPAGADVEPLLREVAEYSSSNTDTLSRLNKDYADVPELRPLIEQITAIRGEYTRVRDTEVLPAIRQGRKDEASALLLGAQFERVVKFKALAQTVTDKLQERSDARLAAAQLVFAILGGLALVTAIVTIVGLSRSIALPLERVTDAARKISEGDLGFEFADVTRTDEMGVLMQTFQKMRRSLTVLAGRAREISEGDLTAQIKPRSDQDVLGNAFANMVTSLRRVMQELLDSANVLAASAAEILASTSQLSATAAETAAAVTETTATVEEVKQTSQVSSEKARHVASDSQKAAEVARTGRASVEQTIEGMGSIRQQMSAVAESILSLSAQSQTIGEIVATVDDLAAQSKLLAVNASIEAAKAGEEGKGFAVVAQEVRSLAEQSKQATAQVRTILGEIQKATSSAVLATEQGSKAVEAGVRQSTSSGDSIRALSENVGVAAQAATQIAATSQQQFVGMDQIAMAMENIKTASTQTVASTRQVETAAQQLHEIGQKLKSVVSRFKV